mmetsp:Transcript_27294/g.73843  ORF Transcript_27294/g.73843 Transcript_27294/m.73843 type:complete len:201 (-) Transcript_27294:1349-1951(-)
MHCGPRVVGGVVDLVHVHRWRPRFTREALPPLSFRILVVTAARLHYTMQTFEPVEVTRTSTTSISCWRRGRVRSVGHLLAHIANARRSLFLNLQEHLGGGGGGQLFKVLPVKVQDQHCDVVHTTPLNRFDPECFGGVLTCAHSTRHLLACFFARDNVPQPVARHDQKHILFGQFAGAEVGFIRYHIAFRHGLDRHVTDSP